MSACTDLLGIKSVDFTLATQVDLEEKLEIAEPLLDKDGNFVKADAYNPMVTFTIRGKGELPDGVLAGAEIAIDNLNTGVTLVSTDREMESAGAWNEWEISGEHAPNAAALV